MIHNEILSAIINVFDSKMFYILLIVCGLDVLLGKARAFKQEIFNSYTGLKGLVNHALVVLIVMSVEIVSILLETDHIGNVFVVFFVFDYITSIYVNAQVLGIPLPEIDFLKEELRRKGVKPNV